MLKYNNLMIDLETLGTRPGCVFFEIGAVFFDFKSKQIGETFHQLININQMKDEGFTIEADTLKWWEKQSDEAQTNLRSALLATTMDIRNVLDNFEIWLETHSDIKKLKVWGNGADFDNPILIECYKKLGRNQPWGNYNNRCYRSLKSLKPTIKIKREGTHHNALDDAISQAKHAIEISKNLVGVNL